MNKCECLSYCGDDPAIKKGKANPCAEYSTVRNIGNWKTIESIPEIEYVLLFTPDWKPSEYPKKGEMQSGVIFGAYSKHDGFVDCYGTKIGWRFTHWQRLPQIPMN